MQLVTQYHRQKHRKNDQGETIRVNVVINVWYLNLNRYLYDFVHLGSDSERETRVGPYIGSNDYALEYLEKCVRYKKRVPYFCKGLKRDWKFIDDKLDSLMEEMK